MSGCDAYCDAKSVNIRLYFSSYSTEIYPISQLGSYNPQQIVVQLVM